MRVERLDVDSLVFERNALAIRDFSRDVDFAEFERGYVAEHSPFYVVCKVPVENIEDVHALEGCGFNLIECQIRSRIRLLKAFDTSPYPYRFEPVTSKEDLKDVLSIAGSTFVHDRFSRDPLVGERLSGERYKRYVMKSFLADDEAVYRLCDPESGLTLAFKTHRYIGNDEVLFLLGGVHPDYKTLGIGIISEYFEFNELIRKGIRRGYTHISAANYSVFNLEIGNLGFRVLTTYAVMRKVYD